MIFQSSDCSSSYIPQKVIPPEDSFNIVFEDSGCLDTGDEVCDDETEETSERVLFLPQYMEEASYPSAHNAHTKVLMVNSTEPRMVTSNRAKDYLYIQMQLCKRNSLKDWLNDNKHREMYRILDIFDQVRNEI